MAQLGDPPSFRAPLGHRIGDVVLLAFIVPASAAAFGFLALIVGLLVAAAAGFAVDDPRPIAAAGAIGGLVHLGTTREWPAWSLILAPDAVRIGPLRAPLPYDAIRFVGAGSRSVRSGLMEPGSAIPVRIEADGGRAYTVQLDRKAADACVAELRVRAPRAAVLDANGREGLPAGRADGEAGRLRLALEWRSVGRLAVAGGAFGLALTAYYSFAAAREGDWTTLLRALAGLPVFAGILGLALRAQRRERRHLAAVRDGRRYTGALQ